MTGNTARAVQNITKGALYYVHVFYPLTNATADKAR